MLPAADGYRERLGFDLVLVGLVTDILLSNVWLFPFSQSVPFLYLSIPPLFFRAGPTDSRDIFFCLKSFLSISDDA